MRGRPKKTITTAAKAIEPAKEAVTKPTEPMVAPSSASSPQPPVDVLPFVLARVAAADLVHTCEGKDTILKRCIAEGKLAHELYVATAFASGHCFAEGV